MYLTSVTLEGWPGLETPVRIDFERNKTVLVGRNGAGKSAVLSAMVQATELASFGDRRIGPVEYVQRHFRCDIVSEDRPYYYEFRQGVSVAESDTDSANTGTHVIKPSWWEQCIELGATSPVWEVKDGWASLAGHGEQIPLPPGVGLLQLGHKQAVAMPVYRELDLLLSGFDLVGAGVPRPFGAERRPIYLNGRVVKSKHSDGFVRWAATEADAASNLAMRLANMHERAPETFAELSAVLRRLNLAKEVTFTTYRLAAGSEHDDFGSVQFDSVNIGHLSDGTLRVTEMLVHLLRAHLTVLCVEEPETAVHPGLLQGVLAELETYGLDRQIVISTHSPTVVNWFRPEQVRLVERHSWGTEVREIAEGELAAVESYLNNEGLLDGYLFNYEA